MQMQTCTPCPLGKKIHFTYHIKLFEDIAACLPLVNNKDFQASAAQPGHGFSVYIKF